MTYKDLAYPMTYSNGQYEAIIEKYSPQYIHQFVVQVEWMSGDADAYEKTEHPIGNTIDDVYRFLDFAPSVIGKRYGDRWEWHKVEINDGFLWFFNGYTEQEYNTEKEKGDQADYTVKYSNSYAEYLKDLDIDWPRDVSCDDCGHASFSGYKIFYYDDNGLQHNVKIKHLSGHRYR